MSTNISSVHGNDIIVGIVVSAFAILKKFVYMCKNTMSFVLFIWMVDNSHFSDLSIKYKEVNQIEKPNENALEQQ